MKRLFLLIAVACTISIGSKAQNLLTPIVDSIPMTQGGKLAVDVHIPAGCVSCPAILIQTPYGRTMFHAGLPLGTGQNIDNSDYVFVVVDWRGTNGSLAALDPNASRGIDGYDCIEWITQQSWSNGKVGTWGPSALGKVQYQTAKEHHPAHICAVPLVAGPQYNYLEYFPGGVYRTEYVEQLDILGYGMSTVLLSNTVYSPTWAFAEFTNNYPTQIEIPFLMIGGWYDHNSDLMISFFNSIRTSSALAVRNQHRLLMGPWVHGGHGAAWVGSATQGELSYPGAVLWNDSLAKAFFDFHIRSVGNGWAGTPYIQYFQMGEDNWQSSAVWPPTGVTPIKLYLQDNHTLSSALPINASGMSAYSFNPSDPSPTVGGPTLRFDLNQGPYDQSLLVENRNDILIFDSPVLGQDVVLKGKVRAHLFVSTDRTDTDFAIRITDVYPDGRSMLVLDGIRRLRFRNGYSASDTAAAVPGQVYELDIDLPATALTFLAGHKIRVDISSANYARFDVNLNNGGVMYTAGDTLIAFNTIYHNSSQASYVEFMLEDFVGEVFETNTIKFSLFPNPGTDQITVNTQEQAAFEIFNMQGKLLLSGNLVQGNNTLSLQSLSSGAYMFKIKTAHATSHKKFLKL